MPAAFVSCAALVFGSGVDSSVIRLGYFIVHQDIMGDINAFANRWD